MTGKELAYLKALTTTNWCPNKGWDWGKRVAEEADQLYDEDPSYWETSAKQATKACLRCGIEI